MGGAAQGGSSAPRVRWTSVGRGKRPRGGRPRGRRQGPRRQTLLHARTMGPLPNNKGRPAATTWYMITNGLAASTVNQNLLTVWVLCTFCLLGGGILA